MLKGAAELNYIVHKGDEKDPGPDQIFVFSEMGCAVWLVEGQETQYRVILDITLPVDIKLN
jgi:hypothetical protein